MTTQPAAQMQPTIEQPKTEQTYQTVGSMALGNVLGGLGLGLLTGFGLWVFGAPVDVYTWTLAAWVAWTGVLMLVRFSIDEARVLFIEADRILLRDQVRRLDEENDALDDLLHERDRTIAQQQAQLVARRNFVGAQPDSLSPTMNDARRLVQWKYGDGLDVTQRWAQREKSWNVNRYAAALNILKGAQIVVMRGTQPEWAKYTSPAVALAALNEFSPVDLMIESSESSATEGE